jgi:hypothetical protein
VPLDTNGSGDFKKCGGTSEVKSLIHPPISSKMIRCEKGRSRRSLKRV